MGLVNESGEVTINKSHLSALDFIRGDMYDWVNDNLSSSQVIMGHTRWPTFQNSVSDKNAQPFAFSSTDGNRKVMLTHNGHLHNYFDLTRKIEKFSHTIDSAHLARAMAEETNTKDLLTRIKGAYACVWYDAAANRMMAAQNGQRSLYMAFSKDGSKAYYASEDVTLEYVLRKNTIQFKEILEVPDMMLCQWDLSKDSLEPALASKYKEKPFRVEAHSHATVYRGGHGGAEAGKKGGLVWVRAAKDAAFSHYLDKQGNQLLHGKVYGEITMDQGSLVQINGLAAKEWDGDLQIIRDSIPCRIQTCEREDDAAGDKFNFYNVILDAEKVKEEVARIKRLQESKAALFEDGPNKSRIPLADWEEISREGCFYCEGTILNVDKGKVGWKLIKVTEGDNDLYQMICPPCVNKIKVGDLVETSAAN